MHQMDEGEPPIGFDGIKKELTEDLVIEAVPIVGMLVSVVVDYAYMRRVNFAARRVFQEALAAAAWQGHRDRPRGGQPARGRTCGSPGRRRTS